MPRTVPDAATCAAVGDWEENLACIWPSVITQQVTVKAADMLASTVNEVLVSLVICRKNEEWQHDHGEEGAN